MQDLKGRLRNSEQKAEKRQKGRRKNQRHKGTRKNQRIHLRETTRIEGVRIQLETGDCGGKEGEDGGPFDKSKRWTERMKVGNACRHLRPRATLKGVHRSGLGKKTL